jgi:hypothetical protein
VASNVTARIRQERSQQKLGFGVPVRARLVLPLADRDAWSSSERDVLAGNNVGAAEVSFKADRMEAVIEPQPPDA